MFEYYVLFFLDGGFLRFKLLMVLGFLRDVLFRVIFSLLFYGSLL